MINAKCDHNNREKIDCDPGDDVLCHGRRFKVNKAPDGYREINSQLFDSQLLFDFFTFNLYLNTASLLYIICSHSTDAESTGKL